MRLLITASLLLVCGCSEPGPPAPSLDDVRAAIEAQNRAFGEAVRAGDTAAIGSLYTADGAVLPPNAARASGREAITEFWSGVLASGVANAVLTTEEVAFAGGDTASEIGSALLSAKDGSALDEGKYIVVWKHEDGAWRLHRDIWNSNRSPASAAPPTDAPADAAPTEGAATQTEAAPE
jgi:uncharacterized protein (TIGR02246 family)